MILYTFVLMLPVVVIAFITRQKGAGLVKITVGILLGIISAFAAFYTINSIRIFVSSSILFLIVPFIEELFKLVAVYVFAESNEEYSRTSCFLIPAGFAMLENALLTSPNNMQLLFLRSFTSLPVHLVASGFYIMSLHKMQESEEKVTARLGLAFLSAYGLHTCYNLLIRFLA
ncbi:PrsW family glutamic-type intramembrane protease [Spirochaetia bacterium 38H-sp]|uniref:PrsW family glutamic-type intramembrane protease n=1 Tax=Rarispira pelagica TaxID=3141764 RepID=A0ABU9UE43_9SPIR